MNKKGGALSLSFSILLIGSFIFAMILFANDFATKNQTPLGVINDSNLYSNKNEMNDSLQIFYDSNNVTVIGLYGSSIEPGSDTLSRVSTFSSGTEDTLPNVGNAGKTAIKSIFGEDNAIWIIAGGFIGFLALVTGYYAWKLLKAGSPD